MFSVDASYLDEKMVFSLREKSHNIQDNGIWVTTKIEHH